MDWFYRDIIVISFGIGGLIRRYQVCYTKVVT